MSKAKLRMQLARLCVGAVVGSPLLVLPPAHAGRNCQESAPDAAQTQKAVRLATQIRDSLELSGAKLVLIGRVGSDQSRRGVRYTHVGYLLREHPAGSWTVVHQLNGCGTGNSDLFDEGLGNFFMDDPFDFEARVVIPSPPVQEKLAAALLGANKRALHEPIYSSIANPWSTRHQNSNGWALEILASALASPGEVTNRAAAQRWLKDKGYRPSQIRIGSGERAGARLFTPHIRFGDHPDMAWQTQTYDISTGDSVLDFLRQIDSESRMLTQRLDGRPVIIATPKADSGRPTSPATAEPRTAPAPVAAAAQPQTPAVAASGQTRAQILQSMQGLIVPYACRPQGYLSQCRQVERSICEKQVSDAVLRCFAMVSDQHLFAGSEQAAMQQMQEVGYCAVEAVDAEFSSTSKQAKTAQGNTCASVRTYK